MTCRLLARELGAIITCDSGVVDGAPTRPGGALSRSCAQQRRQRWPVADMNRDGALVALQAQLDDVADAIGTDRMRAADGYHGTAVLKFVREWNAAMQEARGAQRASEEMREQVKTLLDRIELLERLVRRIDITANGALEAGGINTYHEALVRISDLTAPDQKEAAR